MVLGGSGEHKEQEEEKEEWACSRAGTTEHEENCSSSSPATEAEQIKEANPSLTSGWLPACSHQLSHNKMDFASASLPLAFTLA